MMARKVMTGSSGVQDPILDSDNPNLLTLHTMNDIVGQVIDDASPNDDDATVTGTVATVAGHLGDALSLDGSTQYASTTSTPVDAFTVNATLAAWFKPNTTAPSAAKDGVIMARTNGVDASVNVYYDSTSAAYRGKARIFVTIGDSGTIDWLGGNVLDTARYYCVVITISSGTTASYLYDDTGLLLSTNTGTLTRVLTTGAAGPTDILIGHIGGGSAKIQAAVDQMRSYDISITAGQADAVGGE